VLLLSRPEAYAVRRRVLAAEITTVIRRNPATVELGTRDGLRERCIVNCDNLVTVNQDQLVEYATMLSDGRLAEVRQAVLFALGYDRPCGTM
jgi:mRNA-degrading endonuclease toxin of MazEF toxin-antitoxin module